MRKEPGKNYEIFFRNDNSLCLFLAALSLLHLSDPGKTDVAVGHNFETYIQNFPGSIFFNPAGESKSSFTIEDHLIPDLENDFLKNQITWTSRYPSLTYNIMGKNLPDGGINQEGLYVGEMSLTSSSQKLDLEKTYFFPPLFIRYCLDNFSSTREVLEALKTISPTVSYGFYWQYFITDASGDAAVVSFVQNKMEVNTGHELPYPVLCNYPYRRELLNLKKYQGFGGFYKLDPELSSDSIYIQRSSGERFVRIARDMMTDTSSLGADQLLDRTYEMLEGVTFDITQWRVAALLSSRRMVLEDRNNLRRHDIRLEDLASGKTVQFVSLEKGSRRSEMAEATPADLRRLVYKSVSKVTLVEFFRLNLTDRLLNLVE